MTQTAKLFWSGRFQAVRLPKEFRMEGNEVHIRKQGAAVILEPLATDWQWLDVCWPQLTPIPGSEIKGVNLLGGASGGGGKPSQLAAGTVPRLCRACTNTP